MQASGMGSGHAWDGKKRNAEAGELPKPEKPKNRKRQKEKKPQQSRETEPVGEKRTVRKLMMEYTYPKVL